MAVDVSQVVTFIAEQAGAVALVGIAGVGMVWLLQAFRMVRAALGYGSGGGDSDPVAAFNRQTVAWDAGYTRQQFDSSWSAEEKAAWREGVAAQHEDTRRG